VVQDIQAYKDALSVLSGSWSEAEVGDYLAILSLLVFFGPLLIIEILQERSALDVNYENWSPILRLIFILILVSLIAFCGVGQLEDFEYFQF